jgi:DNA-binding protein HU-beta
VGWGHLPSGLSTRFPVSVNTGPFNPGVFIMNKTELIKTIAREADIHKISAELALQALISAITDSLQAGDSVTLQGFGSFSVSQRPARTGRNPRTGEAVQIAARTTAKFTPGKALKDALN